MFYECPRDSQIGRLRRGLAEGAKGRQQRDGTEDVIAERPSKVSSFMPIDLSIDY